jgi:hypothetical protein
MPDALETVRLVEPAVVPPVIDTSLDMFGYVVELPSETTTPDVPLAFRIV